MYDLPLKIGLVGFCMATAVKRCKNLGLLPVKVNSRTKNIPRWSLSDEIELTVLMQNEKKKNGGGGKEKTRYKLFTKTAQLESISR